MQRLGFILWLAMCVAAQLVASAVPQGATMCVRSVVGLSGVASVAAGEDCCDGCCCDEDSGVCEDEVPTQGPCREQDCSMCVSVPVATTGGTKAEVRKASDWTWATMAAHEPRLTRVDVGRPAVRLHPWSGAPPRCGPPLAGCVILQV